MNPQALLTLLHKVVPAHLPILVSGKPGVGKTAIAQAVAQELGYRLIVSHLVVVLDTSGSIYSDPRLIDQFTAELEAILAMFPSSGFHLLACDTRIQTAEYITAAHSPL